MTSLLVAGLVALMAACSPGPSPEVPVGADGTADAVLVSGRDLYSRQCARCHAADGSGGIGPQVSAGRAVQIFPAIEAQIDLMRSGRNSMPAFGSALTDQELEAIARYTREVL